MFAPTESAFMPPRMSQPGTTHMALFPSHLASCGSASGFLPFQQPQYPGHLSPPMFPMADALSPPHPASTAGRPYNFTGSPAHSVSPSTGNSPPPLCIPLTSSSSLPPPLVHLGNSSYGDTHLEEHGRYHSPERSSSAPLPVPMPSLVPHSGSPASSNSSCSTSGASSLSIRSSSGSPALVAASSPLSSPGKAPGQPFAGTGKLPEFLRDLDDPYYYSMPTHSPDRQIVVLTSRIKEKVPSLAKTRWLDQQLSFRQCPYPIKHIEFTHAGDAVVEFISDSAMMKALARPPLLWGPQEIGTRSCTEDDITALFWVGVLGLGSEFIPAIRQALQPFGEVRGEYAPHPSTVDPAASFLQSDLNSYAPEFVPGLGVCPSQGHATGDNVRNSHLRPPPRPGQPASVPGNMANVTNGHSVSPQRLASTGSVPPSSSGMLKLYFAPSGRRRLPSVVQILLSDMPKGCAPILTRVFTPHGPLAPKCSDFGPFHSCYGCPECSRAKSQLNKS